VTARGYKSPVKPLRQAPQIPEERQESSHSSSETDSEFDELTFDNLAQKRDALLADVKELRRIELTKLLGEQHRAYPGELVGTGKGAKREETALCLSDVHLAVISVKDFERVLKKQEARQVSHRMRFFQSLPFLQHWSREQLMRLLPHCEEVKPLRGQVMYRHGDAAEWVYVVKQGEFEVLVRVEAAPQGRGPRRVRRSQLAGVAILGVGQVMGEEDAGRLHATTVVCKSSMSEVYRIRAREFIPRMQRNEHSWAVLQALSRAKEQAFRDKAERLRRIAAQQQKQEDRSQASEIRGILKSEVARGLLDMAERILRPPPKPTDITLA